MNLGLNVEEPVISILLITLLQAKLPSELARSWERHITAKEKENPQDEPPLSESSPPMRLTFTVLQMLAFVDERLKSDAVAAQISLDHRQDGGNSGGQGGQGNQKKPQQQQNQQKKPNTPTLATGMDGTSPRQQKQMRQLKALIAEHADELLSDVALAMPGSNNSNNRGTSNQNKANNKNNSQKKMNPGQVAANNQKNVAGGGGNKGGSNPSAAKPANSAAKSKAGTIKVDPKLDGTCIWCEARGHQSYGCPNLKGMPITERWDRIRARWRTQTSCVRCLKDGHTSPGCPTQKICGVTGCGRPHATPLHIDETSDQVVASNVAIDSADL
jgi:hypothetical protein